MHKSMWIKNGSTSMLATKWSTGVAQEVILRNPPDFETQKYKTGVLVAPQKRTNILQKILNLEILAN